MSSNYEARIRRLESEIQTLKGTVRPGRSPAYVISMVVAFIVFVVVISWLPLADDPGFGSRAGIGLIGLIGGVFVFGGAFAFIEKAFKALVEIAASLLLLYNAVWCAVIWALSKPMSEWVIANDFAEGDEALGLVVTVAAAVLFVTNVFALLVLYPAAKTAGTRLD